MVKGVDGQGVRGPEGSGIPKKKYQGDIKEVKNAHCTAIKTLEKCGSALVIEGEAGARNKRGRPQPFDHDVNVEQKSELGSISIGVPHKKHKDH